MRSRMVLQGKSGLEIDALTIFEVGRDRCDLLGSVMVLSWFCQELRHCCDSSDAGASVTAEDFEGKSALSAAEENGLPKMRQLLFSYI